MKKSSVAAILLMTIMMAGLLAAPAYLGGATVGASSAHASAPARATSLAMPHTPGATAPLVPTPATGYPRTVFVETFTGVWCPHCPAESQSLYEYDQNTSHNVLSIAELHACEFAPGTGPCGDGYVPPDGTSDNRGAFYNVCGYPDVFVDGLHPVCGAGTSVSQMAAQYAGEINNASKYAGNVSITQSASVNPAANVTAYANVTSAVTGTYNAGTYLLENIGKKNLNGGGGLHGVANVVRETLYNHPVNVTAGQTLEIRSIGQINSAWRAQNLSVITFLQQNSTRIIENANMAKVVTLSTSVVPAAGTITSGQSTMVTVQVANTSTFTPVGGAAITVSSSVGGTFTPSTGTTAANGTFSTLYTAPSVTSILDALISVEADGPSATVGFANATVVLNPLGPPTAPTGLTISPGVANVTLNWTVPASGGGGVTYDLYQSATQSGGYAVINQTTGTQFVATGLAGGATYWFKVDASNLAGFSSNTSAISASAATGSTQGLPSSEGWWVTIDSTTFSSTTSSPLVLLLPDGQYSYTYGTNWYARIPTVSVPTTLTIAGQPIPFTVAFQPTPAVLEGTVTPGSASVTLSGTPIAVDNGSFYASVQPGSYVLNVTTPGYVANSTALNLGPGNITTLNVQLFKAQPSTSGVGPSNSGLTNEELIAIIAVAAIVGAVLVFAGVMSMSKNGRGKRPRSPPRDDA